MKKSIVKILLLLLFIIQSLTGCNLSIGPDDKNEIKTEYIQYKENEYYEKYTGEIYYSKNSVLQDTGRQIYFEGVFNPLK